MPPKEKFILAKLKLTDMNVSVTYHDVLEAQEKYSTST